MKIVCIDPCTQISTSDVYDGVLAGLRANGHEVIPYFFGNRFDTLFKACVDRAQRLNRGAPGVDALLWASELALAYTIRYDPDWVVIVSGMFFHYEALKMFRCLRRRDGSPVRVALMLTESPYDAEKEVLLLPDVDLAWTNERTCVPWFRRVLPETHYLPHAWRPDAIAESQAYAPTVRSHDVVFVGTAFAERVTFLEAVPWAEMDIDLGLYGMWGDLPDESPLRQYVCAGATPNAITLALYQNAKVALNLFRTSGNDAIVNQELRGLTPESLGPRSYELAASGAFSLSDWRAEASDLFAASEAEGPLYFDSPETLRARLEYWLPNDTGRRRVATLQQQAVSGHSWTERARQVVADLERASLRRDVAA